MSWIKFSALAETMSGGVENEAAVNHLANAVVNP
jgi:hypothetical protein